MGMSQNRDAHNMDCPKCIYIYMCIYILKIGSLGHSYCETPPYVSFSLWMLQGLKFENEIRMGTRVKSGWRYSTCRHHAS